MAAPAAFRAAAGARATLAPPPAPEYEFQDAEDAVLFWTAVEAATGSAGAAPQRPKPSRVVLRRGVLAKRGAATGVWSLRHAILVPNKLLLLRGGGDGGGPAVLGSAYSLRASAAPARSGRRGVVAVVGGRTLHLRALSAADADAWVAALAAAAGGGPPRRAPTPDGPALAARLSLALATTASADLAKALASLTRDGEQGAAAPAPAPLPPPPLSPLRQGLLPSIGEDAAWRPTGAGAASPTSPLESAPSSGGASTVGAAEGDGGSVAGSPPAGDAASVDGGDWDAASTAVVEGAAAALLLQQNKGKEGPAVAAAPPSLALPDVVALPDALPPVVVPPPARLPSLRVPPPGAAAATDAPPPPRARPATPPLFADTVDQGVQADDSGGDETVEQGVQAGEDGEAVAPPTPPPPPLPSRDALVASLVAAVSTSLEDVLLNLGAVRAATAALAAGAAWRANFLFGDDPAPTPTTPATPPPAAPATRARRATRRAAPASPRWRPPAERAAAGGGGGTRVRVDLPRGTTVTLSTAVVGGRVQVERETVVGGAPAAPAPGSPRLCSPPRSPPPKHRPPFFPAGGSARIAAAATAAASTADEAAVAARALARAADPGAPAPGVARLRSELALRGANFGGRPPTAPEPRPAGGGRSPQVRRGVVAAGVAPLPASSSSSSPRGSLAPGLAAAAAAAAASKWGVKLQAPGRGGGGGGA